MHTLSRLSFASALVVANAAPARADDGARGSIAISASPRLGPVPGEAVFHRVDALAAHSWRRRLHVGAGVGLGAGGSAPWFAQAFVEAGAWLHASDSLDVLLGWRAGAARFSIDDMQVDALVIEPVGELRWRASPHIDVRFVPITITAYVRQTMNLLTGPEVGLVVRL